MGGKSPKLSQIGKRANFYCVADRQRYPDLEILKRTPMKHADMIESVCTEGHRVTKFVKKEA
jgi:hypothetical protein